MIIERDIYSRIKPVIGSPEAIVITGMRRVGKTILLRYIFDNIASDNKIFIDLENPANQKYFEEKNYERILDTLKFLGLNINKKAYVFLDEVQFVKNSPSVVKYLLDHYKIKFFLSGSASFYLKNLFSESLSGRKYIFELFPLSFSEFLKIKNLSFNLKGLGLNVPKAIFEELDRHYAEYILYGAFPGVAQKENAQEKRMMLDDIFSSYFQVEVKQVGDFRKTGAVRDLMLLLMERSGSKLDIQKISKELSISRETVYSYVSFLENTYFIKLVRPFSRNRDSEIRGMPKVYICDCGLLNRFAKVSEGVLFENSIFQALEVKGSLNYYQKKSGAEIDFILDKRFAYEAKINATDQDLKKLNKICAELSLTDYKMVSRKYSNLSHAVYGFML